MLSLGVPDEAIEVAGGGALTGAGRLWPGAAATIAGFGARVGTRAALLRELFDCG